MHKRQLGSVHIVLAICLLLILIGAVGWLAWQNFTKTGPAKQATVSDSPKPTATDTVQEPASPTGNTKSRIDNSIWSGYVANGATFNEVSGRIKIPTITCTDKEGSVGFWTGFDGYGSQTVEQAGVTATCANASYYVKNKPINGVTYYAWSLMYGAGGMKTFDFAVSPGDVIFYKVAYANSKYTMTVTNETTGKSGSDTQACVIDETTRKSTGITECPRSEAEWVVERTGYNKLAKFTKATLYDNQATTKSGKTGYISLFPNTRVTMSQSGNLLDTISDLRIKGAFDVDWVAPGIAGS